MICVEDWAEIRRLHRAEQMQVRAIARHLGISKNTVKRALASDRPPKCERPAKGSVVDAVEVEDGPRGGRADSVLTGISQNPVYAGESLTVNVPLQRVTAQLLYVAPAASSGMQVRSQKGPDS